MGYGMAYGIHMDRKKGYLGIVVILGISKIAK